MVVVGILSVDLLGGSAHPGAVMAPSPTVGGYSVAFQNNLLPDMNLGTTEFTFRNRGGSAKTFKINVSKDASTSASTSLNSGQQNNSNNLWCPQNSKIEMKQDGKKIASFSFPGGTSGSQAIEVIVPEGSGVRNVYEYTLNWSWDNNGWVFSFNFNSMMTQRF